MPTASMPTGNTSHGLHGISVVGAGTDIRRAGHTVTLDGLDQPPPYNGRRDSGCLGPQGPDGGPPPGVHAVTGDAYTENLIGQ